MEKNSKSVNKVQVPAIISALLIILLCSSCLKNGKYDVDFSKVAPSVDLPLAAANSNGVVAFTFSDTSNTFPVIANLASPSVLSTATTLTLSVDSAYLNTYNSQNGTSYTVLPDSDYSTSGWSLTIPAGKRLDTMMVTFNIAKIDMTQNYVLPVTISQASEPIEQWNHLLIGIGF
jgi:hypothetical protein